MSRLSDRFLRRHVTILALCFLLWPVANARGQMVVGRITDVQGQLLLYVPDQKTWVDTIKDAPFGLSDALQTGQDSRTEIFMPDNVWIRLGPATEVQLVSAKPELIELSASSGLVRIANKSQGATVRVGSPFGTVEAGPGGVFDLYVGPQSLETLALTEGVRFLHVAGDTAYPLNPGGASLIANAEQVGAGEGALDAAWNAWNQERDALWARRATMQADSAKNLPRSLKADAPVLEKNGKWKRVRYKGRDVTVWQPTSVNQDWAPFTTGRWVEWNGEMTWVPDESFGYVTHHYGDWINVDDRWYWQPPSPSEPEPSWYPGRVAWVGSGEDVGWVPLAPEEPYYAHRDWGPGAVAVTAGAAVAITAITIAALANANHAVVVPQRSFYGVRDYTEVRVRHIDRTTFTNNFRAAPVASNIIPDTQRNNPDRFSFTNAPKDRPRRDTPPPPPQPTIVPTSATKSGPGNVPGQPGSPGKPGTTTPGVTAQQPGATPGQPGATPGKTGLIGPRGTPSGTTPGATPGQPGSPGKTGTTPGATTPGATTPTTATPGVTTQQPGTTPGQPGATPGKTGLVGPRGTPGGTTPGATPGQPGSPGKTGTTPGATTPGATTPTTATPGVTTQQPGTTPGQPGATPGKTGLVGPRGTPGGTTPGTAPGQPGTPGKTGTTPGATTPGATSPQTATPTTATQQPGVTTQQPGATPGQPGATPGKTGLVGPRGTPSGATPGATPGQPGTPGKTGTTPGATTPGATSPTTTPGSTPGQPGTMTRPGSTPGQTGGTMTNRPGTTSPSQATPGSTTPATGIGQRQGQSGQMPTQQMQPGSQTSPRPGMQPQTSQQPNAQDQARQQQMQQEQQRKAQEQARQQQMQQEQQRKAQDQARQQQMQQEQQRKAQEQARQQQMQQEQQRKAQDQARQQQMQQEQQRKAQEQARQQQMQQEQQRKAQEQARQQQMQQQQQQQRQQQMQQQQQQQQRQQPQQQQQQSGNQRGEDLKRFCQQHPTDPRCH